MFGVVICPGCQQPRAINLSAKRTLCPRCGKTVEVRKALIHFQSSDSQEVRQFIVKMNDTSNLTTEPALIDPYTVLLKDIRKEKDPVEKMRMMAVALCYDTGTFTLTDLEKLVPGKSEHYLQRMTEFALIVEKKPGVYQVI